MIVGSKLRVFNTQTVEKPGMNLLEMSFDPVPIVLEFDILINGFQDFHKIVFCNVLSFSEVPSHVFPDQPDDLVLL
jgi:hypothetical protein